MFGHLTQYIENAADVFSMYSKGISLEPFFATLQPIEIQ